MSAHDEFDALVDAYALDALDAAERDRFQAHLAGCERCQAALAESLRVLTALGSSVAPVPLPPALKARVIAHAIASAPRSASQPASSRQSAMRQMPATPAWLALAAAVLVVVAGAYAWSLRTQLASVRETMTEADARAAQLRTELLTLRSDSARLSRMIDVLSASDVVRVDLAGQSDAPSATGRAFWSSARGLVFSAERLPALPSGRVYQLWLVTKTSPLSAGLLAPDAAGSATLIASLPGAANAVAVAVTIEPAGGVPSPTGPKVLVGLATGSKG